MRLLSVIHGPAFGGAHNQAAVLAKPLRERGVETIVLLPREAEAAADRLRDAEVDVLQINLGRLRATTNPMVHARFAVELRRDIARIAEVIGRARADVVQVHGPTNPQAALAARRRGVGVTWQLLDTRAPMAVRRLTMPLVARLSDSMTAWGDELARLHPGARKLDQRLIRVYPPVDLSVVRPSEMERREARSVMRADDDAVLVCSVGVLNPQKGHENLIRAAGAMRKDREVTLRIIGTDSPAHSDYKRQLLELAEAEGLGSDVFVDPAERSPVRLLQGADVFALASVPRSEGMPTVILEAMALGKPVVATDVGAVRELVTDGVTGFVVKAGDHVALVTALDRLRSDGALRTKTGEAGFRSAHASFGLDALADLHARAYRVAVERSR